MKPVEDSVEDPIMKKFLAVRDRINKRVETTNQTIKNLKKDHGLAKSFSKEKRWYEGQCEMLRDQALKLERVKFAAEGIKDAQQNVLDLTELRTMMKCNLREEINGLINGSNELIKSLSEKHNMPQISPTQPRPAISSSSDESDESDSSSSEESPRK